MKSKRPKVLHEICGRPMLHYVLRACYDAGCKRALVVVGHGKEEVMAAFADDGHITWVEQTEQLGTGHAARTCEAELREHDGEVFILTGDQPLTRGRVLTTLLNTHRDENADASMATVELDDPTGYGRIIRDGSGNFVEIVEQIDCTPEQAEIREVFPSVYCVRSEALLLALSKLSNNNKKGEYYLTDIFAILRNEGRKVVAVQALAGEETIQPNTRHQLSEADEVMQDRIHNRLREAGVTIVSSVNTYVEDGVTAGPDTVIHPFTFIGRGSSIGAGCVIGPFATLPRETILPEGTSVAGNVSVENAVLDPTSGARP